MVARLSPRLAGLGVVVTFVEIARSGHANSADQRAVAVASDAVHLLAGSVWIGGIAVIVAILAPIVRRLSGDERRVVMRSVLQRFGRVALPAVAVVAVSGLVNAIVELQRPAELWQTSYGIVLGSRSLSSARSPPPATRTRSGCDRGSTPRAAHDGERARRRAPPARPPADR